jgi:hypothetical protein
MTRSRSLQTITLRVDRISTAPQRVLIQGSGAAAGRGGLGCFLG